MFEHNGTLILKYCWQALLIFIGLCCARDEVYWLLRHNDNPPQQKSKGKTAEDLVDRQLPELLFHMEELRGTLSSYVLIQSLALLNSLYRNVTYHCPSVCMCPVMSLNLTFGLGATCSQSHVPVASQCCNMIICCCLFILTYVCLGLRGKP